jgi:hypothetical protein
MPPPAGAPAELWHSRLVDPEGGSSVSLHAIWSPDGPEGQNVAIDLRTTLHTRNRSDIVRLSSDAILLARENYSHLSPEDEMRRMILASQRRSTIRGDRLMLSALGGTLRARSVFYFPPAAELGRLRTDMQSDPTMGENLDQFDLVDWQHDTVWGHDQAVTVVTRGHLYPFGHEATLVDLHRRELRTDPRDGGVTAWLVRRTFIAVHELQRGYDATTHDFPFRSIRITDPKTPLLDEAPDNRAFIPRVRNAPYGFPAIATDLGGNDHAVLLPVMFVPVSVALSPEIYADEIGDTAIARRPISLAEAGAQPLNTVFETVAMRFGHADRAAPGSGRPSARFRPTLEEAVVRIPALVEMTGREAPSRIAYDPIYRRHGFDRVGHAVFARLRDKVPLALPAGVAGGIAAPALVYDGLSRELGVVANAAAMATGSLEFSALDFLDGTLLLGAITLKDLVAVPQDARELARLTPRLVREALDIGRIVRFRWTPPLKATGLPAPLVGNPALTLDVKLTFPAGSAPSAPHVDILGELRGFGFAFETLVRLDFARLSFRTISGQKPHFGADITGFAFTGDLSFVDALSRQLPKGVFSDAGPALAITPQGVRAGITIGLPTLGLGVLTLTGLALSAELSVNVLAPATLRFALSSRERPFLIAYLLLGGGGFFALTVASGRTSLRLEAAIEFGLVAALDLVVARGNVQVTVGLYLSLHDGRSLLEGFVRLFGALEILAIVTISVEFYLGLSFDGTQAKGTARLVLGVRVLFFSKSVTLSVTRRIRLEGGDPVSLAGGAPPPTIAPADWRRYCRAFA